MAPDLREKLIWNKFCCGQIDFFWSIPDHMLSPNVQDNALKQKKYFFKNEGSSLTVLKL